MTERQESLRAERPCSSRWSSGLMAVALRCICTYLCEAVGVIKDNSTCRYLLPATESQHFYFETKDRMTKGEGRYGQYSGQPVGDLRIGQSRAHCNLDAGSRTVHNPATYRISFLFFLFLKSDSIFSIHIPIFSIKLSAFLFCLPAR